MSPPPSRSHVTGSPISPKSEYLHADTLHFRDNQGRVVLLRGVNLSGSSKSPKNQPAHKLERFWEDAEESKLTWIGQPLDLEDGSADVHLARLRAWGFNCIRYVFTWEAVEHKGPKQYDDEYIDYTVSVLRKIKSYGFKVFMDPHQDIWSRFSGGSGAPLWTLHACGLNPRNFTATNAAFIQGEWPNAETPDPYNFPAMIWSTNYTRLACQVMFTLFYAGRDFAPLCVIDGKNIQDWLLEHFLGAIQRVAERISAAGDLLDDCVIGWDSLNEPSEGLIGKEDITIIPASQALKNGPSPTAFQGMQLGMGKAVEVEKWKIGSLGPAKVGTIRLDPKGTKAWLDASAEDGGSKWGWKRDAKWKLGTDIWALHGVWDIQTDEVLKKGYFARNPTSNQSIDFVSEYWQAHWLEYARLIRRLHPEAILFVQPPVFHKPPKLPENVLSRRACLSPHFYDGLTLLTKHWNWFNADAVGLLRGHYSTVVQALRVGETAIRKSLQDQLSILKHDTVERIGEYPTLMGEIGIPYDMDDRKAYGFVDGGRGEGDYSAQQRALDASLNACDGRNALNFTLWTYATDNTHEWGDNWNGEDLSIWSEDDTESAQQSVDYPPSVFSASSSGPSGNSTPRSTERLLQRTRSTTSTTSLLTGTVGPDIIQGGSHIPPRLLLDGARAVGAFCRPFPTKSAGVPLWVEFNVKTSVFRLTLEVDPADYVAPSGETGTLCTEVYVPFVHYATDQSFDMTSSKEREMTSELDVTTSEGSWSLQGQTLLWKYDLPDAKKSIRMELKRRGGPIPQRADANVSWYAAICPLNQCSVM